MTTAREALEAFFPEHGMHTAVQAKHHVNASSLLCSCGKTLQLFKADAAKLGIDWKGVQHGLRNVPTLHNNKKSMEAA